MYDATGLHYFQRWCCRHTEAGILMRFTISSGEAMNFDTGDFALASPWMRDIIYLRRHLIARSAAKDASASVSIEYAFTEEAQRPVQQHFAGARRAAYHG